MKGLERLQGGTDTAYTSVTDIFVVPSGSTINMQAGCTWTLKGTTVTLNGADLNAVSGRVQVYNGTGGTLSAGTLVYVSGWDNTNGVPTVAKSDADDPTKKAQYVVTADIADTATGYVDAQTEITGLNTSTLVQGDILYESTTAGGYTKTAPTAADDFRKKVGVVKTVDASAGIIWFDLTGTMEIAATYLNNLTPGTVTAMGALVVDTNKDLSILRNLSVTNLYAGASGTLGSITTYPTTAAKGSLILSATDSTGDTTTTITNAAQGGTRVYTIPDAGASASFVMSAGTQTLGGNYTFSNDVVFGTTTISEAEIGVLDSVTPGTSAASKAVVLDGSSKIDALDITALTLNGTALTSTAAELNLLSGVTGGAVSASLAVVVDASKDISSFNNLTAVNLIAGASGTLGSITAYPTTAAKGSLILSAADNTGDTSVTITNAAQGGVRIYTIPDAGASTNFVMAAGTQTLGGNYTFSNSVVFGSTIISEAEVGVLDGVTPGTSAANKAVVLDGSSKIDALDITALTLNGTAVTSTAAELNLLDGVTGGTVSASLAVVVDASKDIGDFNNLDAVNFDAGASGTAGSVDIFPATATSGKITIQAADNAADHQITLTNASHGQATVYTVPDIGQATGNVVVLKAAQTTAGELKRADLTEDALQIYGIPLYDIRAADGAPMGSGETAGDHYYDFTANVWLLKGESSLNETEVSVSSFQFILPTEYVSAGDVKLRIKHKVSGTGTLGTCTIDAECYEQDGNGAIGADLVTTTATASTGTWATTDFVVTASGFVAGDILNFNITSSIQETGNVNPLEAHLDGIAVLLDVKG